MSITARKIPKYAGAMASFSASDSYRQFHHAIFNDGLTKPPF